MIYTQCCGIVLMLVLFLFYKIQKRIHLNTEKAFWRTFCATFISISLDIVSVVAIQNMDILPETMVEIICKAYLVSLQAVINFSVLYLCADIFQNGMKYVRACILCLITLVVGSVITFMLPIYYFVDATGTLIYTYGPAIIMAYVYNAMMICGNVILLLLYKAKINPRRRQAVFVWMLVCVVAVGIQFFIPSLLIVGFAAAVNIMIIYLRLENPECNLDGKTGLFNSGALADYLKQLYAKNQKCAILSISFDYSADKRIQAETEADVFMEILHYLSKIQDAFLFKNTDDEIVLVFEDIKKAEETLDTLRERFMWGWGGTDRIHIRPFWTFVPDVFSFCDVKDALSLLKYARDNCREFTDSDLVYVDENIIDKMYQERETEALIVAAIENNRVEVYYQPIFSTKKQRFTSAEALVRIKDSQGNLVPPGVFIDIAEKNGMIIKLGEMVFEKVCQMIRINRPEQYGIEYVEINLSVVQCAYAYLAEDFIRIMDKYHINPGMINLEITESASLQAKKTMLDNMKCLMNCGVRFSLDDFGTGHSNLNYIVDMPVVIVKFDRDMTKAYFENGKAKYVLDAAMHMIHGMNLEIVSEGIETEKQYATMEELGINYIQGYYFSKPLPEIEFFAFLERECRKMQA